MLREEKRIGDMQPAVPDEYDHGDPGEGFRGDTVIDAGQTFIWE